jgi:hypothetical protein
VVLVVSINSLAVCSGAEMALLDFFGTTPDYLTGLLGDDLNRYRQDANQQALQAAALGLLQAGAPSATPGGGALAIARGLQMGQQAYKNALREGVGERLTQMQLQDFMQKRQEEQLMRQQQAQAQRILQGAMTPAQGMIGQTPWNVLRDEEGNVMPGANVRPAGLDINAVIPQLRALGPAGMQMLGQQLGVEKTLADLAKAQQPEGFVLGEGQKRYERLPDGRFVEVAAGAQKPKQLTGIEGNIAKMDFGTDDIAELRNIPGAVEKIQQKATIQRETTQPKINLNDPTAVMARQLDTMKQWDGLLKDSGDATTAARASAFYRSFDLAKAGNVSADGALIYNLAKVYDPSGAVQQGDVNTIIGNRSIPTQVQLLAQKLKTGGTFTPKERNDMKSIIDSIVDERQKMLAPQLNSYRKINRDLGGTDESITNPYDFVKKPRGLGEILGR